jgi:hypothetical protein
MHCARERTVTADQFKDCKSVFVANNGFAVYQARANRQLADCRCNKGKAARKVVSGACD